MDATTSVYNQLDHKLVLQTPTEKASSPQYSTRQAGGKSGWSSDNGYSTLPGQVSTSLNKG